MIDKGVLGRIYRPISVASGNSRVCIGTIDKILTGQAKPLLAQKVNMTPLEAEDSGETLVCKLSLDVSAAAPQVTADDKVCPSVIMLLDHNSCR